MISPFVVAALLLGQDPPVKTAKIETPEKALRIEVVVPASLDDVWTAFTTTSGLETWLWREARVDLRPGGDWLVLYPGGKTGGGSVISFTAKRQLVLSAMAPEQFPTVRRERTRASFEFETVSASETRVVLVQTGWKTGPEWNDAYDYLAEGNAQLLGQLLKRFVSGPIRWPSPAPPPSGCEARPEARQFDFWAGDWDVHDPQGQLVGRSHVEKILSGCVIQENWTGLPGLEGKSWNYYDTTDREWHQLWLDAGGGPPARLAGAFADGVMTLQGPSRKPGSGGVPALTRLTFRDLAPNKVRQVWEQSHDGGKTWSVAFDGEYRRR